MENPSNKLDFLDNQVEALDVPKDGILHHEKTILLDLIEDRRKELLLVLEKIDSLALYTDRFKKQVLEATKHKK